MQRAMIGLLLAAATAVASACTGEPRPASDGAGGPSGPLLFFEESCCENDLACQDGNWCTGIETCDCWGDCGAGEPPCQGVPDPANACLEYDGCVIDRTDAPGMGYGQGHCEIVDHCEPCDVPADCTPSPDPCNTVDCVGNLCVYPAADCSDVDLCTNDSCESGVGCMHTPILCTDPNPCLVGACDPASGDCVFTDICCHVDGDCPDDGNACTTEVCNATTGTCTSVNNTGPCAPADYDANPCTDEICGGGACTHPAWPAPSSHACAPDGNVCTQDICQADTTCGHPPLAVPSSQACVSDGEVCTQDLCTALGTCGHTAWPVPSSVACPTDGEVCTQDYCGPLGTCTHPAWPDPASHACATDGNECTQDYCGPAGTCTHPAWPDPASHACATDGNVCSNDICSAAGACTHVAWASPSTIACSSDSNACTRDLCQADMSCGHLAFPDGSLPLGCCNDSTDCADGNVCTTDACLANYNCQVPAAAVGDGTVCTPGGSDPCLIGGTCLSGLCTPVYNDPPNETCATSEALALAGGIPATAYGFDRGDSSHGDTTCAVNDYSAYVESDSYDIFYGCTGDAAADLVYDFSFSVGTDYEMYEYVVDMYRSGTDPHTDEFMYTRSTCTDGTTQYSCNDDCNYPGWTPLAGYCAGQLPSALSASAVVPPIPIGESADVSVIADGYGANTGEFDVRARRRIHDNNGCTNWSNVRTEPLITDESVWRGNTTGYTNYHQSCFDMDSNGECDTPPGPWWSGPSCVTPVNASCPLTPVGFGYDDYVCTASDPFEAGWVARFPSAGSWHVYVDERANAGSFNTALALWGPNEGTEDCGFGAWYGCNYGSGAEPASMRVDVAASDVGDVFMIEISNVDALARGNYELNVVYEDPQYRGLHELFASTPDLAGYRVDFTPLGTGATQGYSYATTAAATWPINPWGAGVWGQTSLGDEGSVDGTLPFYVLLGDVFYRNVRIYANGRVRFFNGARSGADDYTPTVAEHYSSYYPQIAPFWKDLYNSTVRYGSGLFEGQSVFWLAWVSPTAYYGYSTRYTFFQVIFHIDGKVTYYYNRIDALPSGNVLIGNSGTAGLTGTAVNYR